MHDITWSDLGFAAILVCLSMALSLALRLGLTRRIVVAAVRTVLQLSAIGLILQHVFAAEHPAWVVVIVLVMTLSAGFSAGGHGRHSYRGLQRDALLALWLTSWLVAAIGFYTVLHVRPWYSPQYVIPILGMILGNTLTTVTLTFEHLTQALAQQRGQIETLLALGAHPWEAFGDVARQAVKAGMTPTLNSMSVVGIVSLPGMMTGQILAGGAPEQAVRYQIVIMFFLCAAAALSGVLAIWRVYRRFFNRHACFNSTLLQRRQ